MILHDAATTFTSIITAAFAWVEMLAFALAFTVAVVGLAAAPLFAPTTRRGIRRPTAPARRHVPSWAHTEPYDYDEAA
ncbi:hypothetical protein ACFC8N_42650 [Streptomyces sp. NPDC055966]|uniref:hypothetical protein n=1 Tax=Streptomyces sp. NPDC055966 TaxID=3345669 RepID=UPI0035E014F0